MKVLEFLLKSKLEKQVTVILMAFLMASFLIFENIFWGRYVYFGIALLICLIKTKGRVHLSFDAYCLFNFAMIVYTFFSAIWAWNAFDSIARGLTLFQGFICIWLVYVAYIGEEDVSDIFTSIKWAGYIIVCYSVKYWGLSFLVRSLNNSVRMDNDYANVNSIGMLIAIALTIQAYEIFSLKKYSLAMLMGIPSIMILAATQSRKALLIMVAGVIFSMLDGVLKQKKSINKLVSLLGFAIMGCVFMYAIATLPMFEGIMARMNYLLNMITGTGSVGASADIRSRMISIGWKQFLKTPIIGIGIDCCHILSAELLSFDAYLHNNFIELLCGGGIIGFSVFYGRYIYIVYSMIKLKEYKDEYFELCFIMLGILFVMDYAYVSYFTKSTYLYWILYFIYVDILKKRRQEGVVYCLNGECFHCLDIKYGKNKICKKTNYLYMNLNI